MSVKSRIDLPNGQYAEGVALIDPISGLPYGGSSGGSGGTEDLLFIDDAGVTFVYRDNGATPPVFTAYRVPTGVVYTVGSNPRPYSVRDVTIAALTFPSSTGNNSIAQLASGATFTGTIETVLSLQAAQVMIVCDTAYTWTIESFIDAAGTQKNGTITRTMLAGEPTNFNQQLPGNYFRVKVTNNGGSTTTTFVLATTFGIMDGVDNAGYQPVSTPLAAVYAIQQLATASAVALPSKRLLNGIIVKAAATNVERIVVGASNLIAAVNGSGTGYALNPGEAISFSTDQAANVFIMLATGNVSATDFVYATGN